MKKIIIKILIITVLLICIAVGAYFLIKAVDIKTLKETLGETVWFWIIIGMLQIFQVIFIPVSNQLITVPMALLFKDDLLKVWITSWVSIWLATVILYFIGRWGGEKLLKWILSDTDKVNKCKKFLKRGWIYYPLGMLLPLPDDIITALAGTAKLNIVIHTRHRHGMFGIRIRIPHEILVGMDNINRRNIVINFSNDIV